MKSTLKCSSSKACRMRECWHAGSKSVFVCVLDCCRVHGTVRCRTLSCRKMKFSRTTTSRRPYSNWRCCSRSAVFSTMHRTATSNGFNLLDEHLFPGRYTARRWLAGVEKRRINHVSWCCWLIHELQVIQSDQSASLLVQLKRVFCLIFSPQTSSPRGIDSEFSRTISLVSIVHFCQLRA